LVNDDATMAGGIVTPNFMELLMQLSGQMTALWSEQVANRQAIRALQENLAAAASTSIATSTAPTSAINFDPMDIDDEDGEEGGVLCCGFLGRSRDAAACVAAMSGQSL
jgi:hypothetical protein